jgi:hypothetical protein
MTAARSQLMAPEPTRNDRGNDTEATPTTMKLAAAPHNAGIKPSCEATSA